LASIVVKTDASVLIRIAIGTIRSYSVISTQYLLTAGMQFHCKTSVSTNFRQVRSIQNTVSANCLLSTSPILR